VCDAVFDTVGGEVATRSFEVLRPGGRAAFIGSGNTAPASRVPASQSLRPKVGRDRAHLEKVAALVASGAVRVPEITDLPALASRRSPRRKRRPASARQAGVQGALKQTSNKRGRSSVTLAA
jgi:NADPH:quinone reductase-like Zn-dependent oxidoreductase